MHISPIEIKKILDKSTGDGDSQQEEKQSKKLSPYARAIQMFKEGYQLEDVATAIGCKNNLYFFDAKIKVLLEVIVYCHMPICP